MACIAQDVNVRKEVLTEGMQVHFETLLTLHCRWQVDSDRLSRS
jgi:hypothetical protein